MRSKIILALGLFLSLILLSHSSASVASTSTASDGLLNQEQIIDSFCGADGAMAYLSDSVKVEDGFLISGYCWPRLVGLSFLYKVNFDGVATKDFQAQTEPGYIQGMFLSSSGDAFYTWFDCGSYQGCGPERHYLAKYHLSGQNIWKLLLPATYFSSATQTNSGEILIQDYKTIWAVSQDGRVKSESKIPERDMGLITQLTGCPNGAVYATKWVEYPRMLAIGEVKNGVLNTFGAPLVVGRDSETGANLNVACDSSSRLLVRSQIYDEKWNVRMQLHRFSGVAPDPTFGVQGAIEITNPWLGINNDFGRVNTQILTLPEDRIAIVASMGWNFNSNQVLDYPDKVSVFDPKGGYLGSFEIPTSIHCRVLGCATNLPSIRSNRDGSFTSLRTNRILEGAPANAQAEISVFKLDPQSYSILPSTEIVISKPQITGSNKVGGTLSARVEIVDPSDSIVSYTWLRDGITIAGANQPQYTLTQEDFLHLISVRVTGERENYLRGSHLSDEIRIEAGTIAANSKPTVRGDSALGSTLFVETDIHSDRVSYLWLRNGLSTGISSESYKTDLQDLGAKISVQVTYSNFGYLDYSIKSDEILIPLKVSNAPCSSYVDTSAWLSFPALQPTISGSSALGSTLSGITGSWASGTKFCAYWYSNGSAIPGAMSSRYKVQSSDIGNQIQYVVIGTDKSGKSVLRYSQPITITKALFTSAKLPKITGAGKVGVKLSGSVTNWTAGVNYSYQWLRNGIPIKGAQSSTYVPTADDLGTTLGIQACGSKDYFETLCLTSPSTVAVIKGVISPAPSVKIESPSTKPGAVLTGVAGNWPSGVALAIQWFRDGMAIQGETNISHTITQADRGHSVAFQVTGTANGYIDCVKVSAAKKIP